jgi:signal transduction histidine kinase
VKARLRKLVAAGVRARLLGVVLLAVLPLAVLLFGYASSQNAAAQTRARTDVQSRLQSDAASLRDLVAESRATLETFGITFGIQSRNWVLVQGNADRLKALHPDYVLTGVADPSGRIIVSSTDHTGTVNVAGLDYFTRAVATRGLVVSGYQMDPEVGRPTIVVAYPAYDVRDRLIGVEFIAFDPGTLRSRLAPAASPGSVEVLIDASGTVVARQPTLAGAEGAGLTSAGLVKLMLAKKTGTATVAGLDGITREYFFAPVFPAGEGSLYLASGYSPEQLLAGQQRAFTTALIGFGVVALLALLAAWIVGTFSVYRPLERLGEAAARLSQGDLSARSRLNAGEGEIGALARSFDEMAASLERQVADLEQAREDLGVLNSELEERVRRRTAELQASNQELEAFNYSVSHDLRAPLRAIDGFSQALIEDYYDALDERGRDELGRVKAAANRMGELIDSLLALSRLTRVDMDVQDVDLSGMASAVVEELRGRDPERRVDVSVEPGVVAKADPVLVRSVLENLLGNAWKFTARTPDPRIEFGCVEQDGESVYFVKDSGAGFDMAYADKLFGAFQRLHDQKEFPGTGVGLATVARVVHRHGGRVWADGRPGEGAAFYFTLR